MRPRAKPLTPIVQLELFRKFDQAGSGSVQRQVLSWNTTVRPSAMSRAYGIRITAKFPEPPDVFVTTPSLKELCGGRRIPHLYDQEKIRLCLYYPGSIEYCAAKPMVAQMLPWTATWLYYFEEWLVSDNWKGGGVHPGGMN